MTSSGSPGEGGRNPRARWKFEYPLSLPGPFVKWYMSGLRFRPRLMAVCAQLRISAQSSMHRSRNCAPLFKSASRWPGPRRTLPFPSQPQRIPCLRRAGGPTWHSRCPVSCTNRSLRNYLSPCDSCRTSWLRWKHLREEGDLAPHPSAFRLWHVLLQIVDAM